MWICSQTHEWVQTDASPRRGAGFGAWNFIDNELHETCPGHIHYPMADKCIKSRLNYGAQIWDTRLREKQIWFTAVGGWLANMVRSSTTLTWLTSSEWMLCWRWVNDAKILAKYGDPTGAEANNWKTIEGCPVIVSNNRRMSEWASGPWSYRVIGKDDFATELPEWTCPYEKYHDGRCDCGCNTWDPDCGDDLLNIEYGNYKKANGCSDSHPFCNPTYMGRKCSKTKTGSDQSNQASSSFQRPKPLVEEDVSTEATPHQAKPKKPENAEILRENIPTNLAGRAAHMLKTGQANLPGWQRQEQGQARYNALERDFQQGLGQGTFSPKGSGFYKGNAVTLGDGTSRLRPVGTLTDNTMSPGEQLTLTAGESEPSAEPTALKINEVDEIDSTLAHEVWACSGAVAASSSLASHASSKAIESGADFVANVAEKIIEVVDIHLLKAILKGSAVTARIVAKGARALAKYARTLVVSTLKATGWCNGFAKDGEPAMTAMQKKSFEDKCVENFIDPLLSVLDQVRLGAGKFWKTITDFYRDNLGDRLTFVITADAEAHAMVGGGVSAGFYITTYPGQWGFKIGLVAGLDGSFGTGVSAGVSIGATLKIVAGGMSDLERNPYSFGIGLGVEEIIKVNLGFAVTIRNPTGVGEMAEFDRLAVNMKATATVDPDVGLESEGDDAEVGSGESFTIETVLESVQSWATRCAGIGVLPIKPACVLALSISVNVGVGVAADGGLVDFRFTKNMAGKTVGYMSEGAVAIEGGEFLQLQGSQTFVQIFGQSLAIAAGKTAVGTSFGTDLEAKITECPVIAKEYLNQLNSKEALVRSEKKLPPRDPNACVCNLYLDWVQEQPEEEQGNMWSSAAETGCSSTKWASALDTDSPYYAYIAKFGAHTKCNVPEPPAYVEDWRNTMTRDELIEQYVAKLQSCKKHKALVAGVKSFFAKGIEKAQKLAPERTLSALKKLAQKA